MTEIRQKTLKWIEKREEKVMQHAPSLLFFCWVKNAVETTENPLRLCYYCMAKTGERRS